MVLEMMIKKMAVIRLIHLITMTALMTFISSSFTSVYGFPVDDPCAGGLRTAASVTFSEQMIDAGSIMYQTVYSEHSWAGDLVAICIDRHGGEAVCQCEDQLGNYDDCEDFTPGYPEIKWSVDTIAWNTDIGLNKNPEDGWWNRRNVITYSFQALGGVAFRYDTISDEQRKWLRYDPDLLRYVRGDRSLEPERFRTRSSYYGDFINSVPVHYGSVILAGANDGMLHVFDEQDGHEYFSYIPNAVFSQWPDQNGTSSVREELLARIADEDYQDNHSYFVDGTVSVRYLEDRKTTLVAGSLGRGGKGIYGLNIFGLSEMEDPEEMAADIVMWEYPDPTKDRLQVQNGKLVETDQGADESMDAYDETTTALAVDPYLGIVYGTPQIVKIPYPEAPGYKWVVIFANGYLSYNQTPVLYILDAYDGRLIKRVFTTKYEDRDQPEISGSCRSELGCNGLSTPELVDYDEDGIVDYGYGGDLRGNMWKFDFTAGHIYGADGYIASFHDTGELDVKGIPAPRPLITVSDNLGNPQPITAKPTLTRPCTASGAGLMVQFGTGIPDDDISADQTQSVYGIWDWQELWVSNPDSGIEPESAWLGRVVSPGVDAGTRSLANIVNIFSMNHALHIGLLEQYQIMFAGVRFYEDTGPGAGGIREIVEDPLDYDAFDQVVRTMTDHRIKWFSPEDLQSGLTDARHLGWVFDLPLHGEHLAGEPKVLDGVLYYTTSLGTQSSCDDDQANAMIMAHDSCSGGGTTDVVFDINGDNWLNLKDGVVLYDINSSGKELVQQAAGVLTSGVAANASIVSSRGRDILYMPDFISGEHVDLDHDAGNLADHRPEVEQRTVRGKNLGVSFWRELF